MSELGNRLRDARIEKGYTLNTLQQKTKIQKKYLQAIEDGQFQEMPGQFYVRAFVKQYADMVGLNGDQLLLDHQDELMEMAEEKPQVEETPLPSRLKQYHQGEKNQWELALNYLPMALLIGLILFIILVLIYAIQSIGKENTPSEVSVDENQPVVTVVQPETVSIGNSDASQERTPSTTQEPALAANQMKVGQQVITLISDPTDETVYQMENPVGEYEFEVKADDYVWVGIYTDDVIQVDTPVSAGDSVKYTAPAGTQSVRIRLGYPEGGKIYVNGQLVEPKSDFIKETILFVLGDNVQANATIPLNLPDSPDATTAQATLPEDQGEGETTGFQGPAVYDPNNNGE